MNSSTAVLLGYIGWTLAMALLVVLHRGLFMLNGSRRINGFTADNKGLSDLGERLARVHANCVENLPIVVGLLLYAVATHRTDVTDGLAVGLLALRVAQSLIHISGASAWQVTLRLGCFLCQIAISAYWLWGLALR